MVTYKNAGFAYYIEPSYGTAPTMATATPSTGEAHLQFTRLVDEDLNTNFTREESNEVRGDAQTSGSVITAASGGGTINIQYSLDTYDEWLPAVLFSEHSAQGAIEDRDIGWLSFSNSAGDLGPTINPSLSGNDLTIGIDLTTGSEIQSGDYIYISESGQANLDGVWKVSAITTTVITLVNDTGAANAEAYVGSGTVSSAVEIRVMQDICENGTNAITLGFVRAYSDASNAGGTGTTNLSSSCEWAIFRGAYLTSLQLSVAPGQAGWTGSFSTFFKDEVTTTDATSAATGSGLTVATWAATTPPNTNALPDAITGVAQIRIAGGSIDARYDALSMNVNINNNAEEIAALRNRGALDVNQGTMSASIDMEILYDADGKTIHDSMLGNDVFVVEFAIQDGEGRCLFWRFPKCKLTSERPNPGKNAPIVQKLSFSVEAGGTDYAGNANDAKMIEVIRFHTPTAYAAL